MPPHNMPVWHDDHCELKAIKKQQTEEELSVLSLTKFIFINMSPSPIPKRE